MNSRHYFAWRANSDLLGGHLLHADPGKLRGQPGELARNDLKYNSAFERVLCIEHNLVNTIQYTFKLVYFPAITTIPSSLRQSERAC